MEYSQLEQERRNRRWSRAYVEEISGISPATLSDAEKGKHEPNTGTREELCRLYGKTPAQLGLEKSDRIGVGHTNAPTSQEEPPMSDLIRREVFQNSWFTFDLSDRCMAQTQPSVC